MSEQNTPSFGGGHSVVMAILAILFIFFVRGCSR